MIEFPMCSPYVGPREPQHTPCFAYTNNPLSPPPNERNSQLMNCWNCGSFWVCSLSGDLERKILTWNPQQPTIYKWMEMVISNQFLYKDLANIIHLKHPFINGWGSLGFHGSGFIRRSLAKYFSSWNRVQGSPANGVMNGGNLEIRCHHTHDGSMYSGQIRPRPHTSLHP